VPLGAWLKIFLETAEKKRLNKLRNCCPHTLETDFAIGQNLSV